MTTRHVLTILAVSDVARSARFYADTFGWPREVDLPVYVELALPGSLRLGLYARAGFAANTGEAPAQVPPGGIGPTELYLHTDDLEQACTRLREAGARELSGPAPRPWGDRAAYFSDPDGNVVVVATPDAR